jgi:hypothetical protein
MKNVIDKIYLPFSVDELKPHFTGDADKQIKYYKDSADRYHEFVNDDQKKNVIQITKVRFPRQIEKDERFWTITATKNVFDDQSRTNMLKQLLVKTFGIIPPISSLSTWEECLDGDLRLYFEACLPSTKKYVKWLGKNLKSRQIIPYIRNATERKNDRTLEGPTHIDAMFLNITNGFAWLIEAKVLSDVSYMVSFDNFRNQIARNIDVMLDNTSQSCSGLEKRDPQKSLFSLLTPMCFKQNPHSRLYGWLMQEYEKDSNALKRDLPHREETDWDALQQRIGWVTFEDFEEVRPGTCQWHKEKGANNE